MTEQQKWNRYVKAINYCITQGYHIIPIDSNGNNVKSIKVIKRCSNKETTVNLKSKHYKSLELLNLIKTQLG